MWIWNQFGGGTDCQGPSPNRKLSAGRSESSIIYPVTMPAARRRTATEAEIQISQNTSAGHTRSQPSHQARNRLVLWSLQWGRLCKAGTMWRARRSLGRGRGGGNGNEGRRAAGQQGSSSHILLYVILQVSVQVLFVLNGIDRRVFFFCKKKAKKA